MNGDKIDAADYLKAGGDLEAALRDAKPMGTVSERHGVDVARARAALAAAATALGAPQVQRAEQKAVAKALGGAVADLGWLAVLYPAEWAAACNVLSTEPGFGEAVKNLRRAVSEASALAEREVREEKRRKDLATRQDSHGQRAGDDPEPAVERALLRKMKMVDGELVPGSPLPCLSNLEHIFALDSRWQGAKYNKLTSLVEVNGREQDAETDTESAIWCHRTYSLDAPVEKVVAAMRYVAIRQHAYDPLRDYLDGLAWDGEDRISGLFQRYFAVADLDLDVAEFMGRVETDKERRARANDLIAKVSRCFFIGAVARAYEPGCKVDSMPVFVGTQGKRKSTTIRALVPHADWFSDTHVNMSDKDRFQQLDGVWIYEMGEMDFVRGAALTRVKGYITSQTDRYRKPYAHAASKNPRRTVFFGSTNLEEFVDDSTGMRRFVPVKCDKDRDMDPEGLALVRDQVWAQAVYLWRAGTPHHLAPADEGQLATHAERFRITSPWEEPIAAFLASDEKRTEYADGFHINVILGHLGIAMDKREDNRLIARATGILSAMGCEKGRAGSHGGPRPRVWKFPKAEKGG